MVPVPVGAGAWVGCDRPGGLVGGGADAITGGNVKRVNTWVDENAAELDHYAEAQGHGYRQNVGKDLSVIKWSEAAYGAYELPEGYFG